MDYKTLKKLLETLQACNEQNIIIEKEVMLSIVEEVLIMRRRTAAKIRQDLANNAKEKQNRRNDLEAKNSKASFHRKPSSRCCSKQIKITLLT